MWYVHDVDSSRELQELLNNLESNGAKIHSILVQNGHVIVIATENL